MNEEEKQKRCAASIIVYCLTGFLWLGQRRWTMTS